MNQSFKLFQSKQPRWPAPAYGAAIYTHPERRRERSETDQGGKEGNPRFLDFGCPGDRERPLVTQAR